MVRMDMDDSDNGPHFEFVKPEHLDVMVMAGQQSAEKAGNGKLAAKYTASITGGTMEGREDIGCRVSLEKSYIEKLESNHSKRVACKSLSSGKKETPPPIV